MTLFMNTELPEGIAPEGWSNWGRESNESTARYMEYKNTGKGADPSKRVRWSKVLSDAEASEINLQQVMKGADDWEPATLIEKYSDYLK